MSLMLIVQCALVKQFQESMSKVRVYVIIVAIIPFIGISKIISSWEKNTTASASFSIWTISCLFPILFFPLRKTHLEFNFSLYIVPNMNSRHVHCAFHITQRTPESNLLKDVLLKDLTSENTRYMYTKRYMHLNLHSGIISNNQDVKAS